MDKRIHAAYAGFQEALLLKGLKIVFERPWQCAICELLMPFPYRVRAAWIQSSGILKGAPGNTAYVACIRMSI
jgi:hypothetical protein